MKSSDDQSYRLGVGMMIINAANKIFVGQRSDLDFEAWQMPQGAIDSGEDPSQAALREMLEELGTDNGKIIAETKRWYTYDLPSHIAAKYYDGKYRGQKQKWFLIKFRGDDQEINIYSASPSEFNSWKWVEVRELLLLIAPFKSELYRAVIQEFKYYLL